MGVHMEAAVINTIQAVLPGESLFSRISHTLEYIQVCEEAIDWGMRIYPGKRQEIFNLFMTLGQHAGMFEKYIPRLFGSFCKEIIIRIGEGMKKKDDLQAGTAAECMIVFCEASLVAPLSEDGAYCYFALWQEVFGEVPGWLAESGVDISPRPSYKDMYELEVGSLRRKIANARKIEYPDWVHLKPVPEIRDSARVQAKVGQLSFLEDV